MKKSLYVIGALIILVIAFWYVYPSMSSLTTTPADVVTESSGTPAETQESNTTTSIEADLGNIKDDSAELDQEAAASAQSVQGF